MPVKVLTLADFYRRGETYFKISSRIFLSFDPKTSHLSAVGLGVSSFSILLIMISVAGSQAAQVQVTNSRG